IRDFHVTGVQTCALPIFVGFARQMCRKVRPDAVCVGAAAAVCGAVGRTDGVVSFGPNIGFADAPFGAELTKRLDMGLPVAVGNRSEERRVGEEWRSGRAP